ncbi:MAG TPA: hypothetical protein VEX60_16975 [Pyrinomonadaceae bacterium]|nr:hypothetical protein [Pyrinomonadaceae bacterium]
MGKGTAEIHLAGSQDKIPGVWKFDFDTYAGLTSAGMTLDQHANFLGYKARGKLRGISYYSNARTLTYRPRSGRVKRGVKRITVDEHIHTLKGRFSVDVFQGGRGYESETLIDQLGGDFTIEFHSHQSQPVFTMGGSGTVKAQFVYDAPRPNQTVHPASFNGSGICSWAIRPTNMIEGKNFQIEFTSVGSSIPLIKSGKRLPDTSWKKFLSREALEEIGDAVSTSVSCNLGMLSVWDKDAQYGRLYTVALVGGLVGGEVGAGEDFSANVTLQRPCPNWNNALVMLEKGPGFSFFIKLSLYEKLTIQLPTNERVQLGGSGFALKFKQTRFGGQVYGALYGKLSLIRTTGK